MAFLAPAAAGAAGTAAATGGALATGLSAGTILGTGAASSGILGGLGLNALGGMASTLPASASLLAAAPAATTAAGLGAAAPGIFSAAAPALGGLKTLAGPGLFNTMGMSPLGGLAGATGVVPSVAGAIQTLPAAATPLLQAAGANPLFGANQLAASTNLANMQGGMLNAINQNVAGGLGSLSPSAFNAPLTEAAKLNAIGGGTTQTINTALNKAAADANLANINAGVQKALGTSTAPTAVTTGPAPYTPASSIIKGQNFLQNAGNFFQNPSVDAAIDYAKEHPYATAAMGYGAYQMLKPDEKKPPEGSPGMIRPYEFSREVRPGVFDVGAPIYSATPGSSAEQLYFDDTFTAQKPYFAPGPEYKKAAEGGVMGLAVGGPVETMSAMNAVGGNMQYPQAGLQTALYSNPMIQRPEAVNVISPSGDAGVGAYSGEPRFAGGGISRLRPEAMNKRMAAVDTAQAKMQSRQGQAEIEKAARSGDRSALLALQQAGYDLNDLNQYASGGISNLGGYSDGGRLLKGPGDGVSDSIPAVIGNRQPARLADGEFVVPARIVSEIGNGSTEAGARKLYAMMDRVQKARRKTVGKGRVAANTKADKYLPA